MKLIGNELKASVDINRANGEPVGTYVSFFVPLKDQKARNTLKKYVSEFSGKDISIEVKGAARYAEHINS